MVNVVWATRGIDSFFLDTATQAEHRWTAIGWGQDIKITYSQIFEYSLGNMKEYSTHEKPIRFSLT